MNLRGFEWRYLWRLSEDRSRLKVRAQRADVWSVAFSPDGKTLAAGTDARDRPGRPGSITLWDLKTKRARDVLLAERQDPIRCVVYSPDGTLLASV